MHNPQDKSQETANPTAALKSKDHPTPRESAPALPLCPKHTSLLSDYEISNRACFCVFCFNLSSLILKQTSAPKISPPNTNHPPTPLHCSDVSELKTKAAVDALDDTERDGSPD